MYTFHYDHPAQHWNVFNPAGYYVASFFTAAEARAFCDYANMDIKP